MERNEDRATTNGSAKGMRSEAPGSGIVEYFGAEADAEAARTVRRAEHVGVPDPVEDLLELVRTTGDATLALDPLNVRFLHQLRMEGWRRFAQVRSALKAAGLAMKDLDGALSAEDRRQKAAEREHTQRASAEHRAALDAVQEAAAAALEAERAADPDRRVHYADVTRGPHQYTIRPGRTLLTEQRPDGRLTTTSLAEFSAVIVEQIERREAPDAPADLALRMSVCVAGDATPRYVVIPAASLDSMDWMARVLGTEGADRGPGSSTDGHLRRAIAAASRGVTVSRRQYGYLGWVEHHGEQVYLHAGGAIGAAGPVAELVAVPPPALRHYVLPAPPTGTGVAPAIRALVDLVSLEPATVIVPMVALAFHAPLGGSRCAVHVTGASGVGKTLLASLVQRLFGGAMDRTHPPGSWEGSPAGTYPLLAGAGDAVFFIDDLRSTVPAQRVDAILRAHFNESSAARGRRDGGTRALPESRCDLLSVGEIDPKGDTASTINRISTVGFDGPLPPNVADLDARATAGELSSGMALYIQWLASQIGDLRPRAIAEERAAALRFGFEIRDRTADLMGGLALGAESLLRFFTAFGVPAAEVEQHRKRMMWALQSVASAHRTRVADEDVGRRLLSLVLDAIGSGRAHTPAIVLHGAHKARRTVPPADAHAWGYELQGDEARPRGDCVGYHHHESPGVLYLLPGPALAAARLESKRQGRELGGDTSAMGKALHALGCLAKTSLGTARARIAVPVRTADGSQPDAWAVRLDALGEETPPSTNALATSGTSAHPEGVLPGGSSDEVAEFPSDIDPFDRG